MTDKIRSETFRPDHLRAIQIDPDNPDPTVESLLGRLDARAEQYAKAGPAWTMFDGSRVVACGGVITIYPGSGEAWLLLERGFSRPLSLTRYLCEALDLCFGHFAFHRIQATVMTDNRPAHRLIQRLGFIPEGSMLYYGAGKEHFIRYARFNI